MRHTPEEIKIECRARDYLAAARSDRARSLASEG